MQQNQNPRTWGLESLDDNFTTCQPPLHCLGCFDSSDVKFPAKNMEHLGTGHLATYKHEKHETRCFGTYGMNNLVFDGFAWDYCKPSQKQATQVYSATIYIINCPYKTSSTSFIHPSPAEQKQRNPKVS